MSRHKWYDDPTLLSRVHATGIVAWISAVPVSYYFGWLASVTYVSALSITALALAHWSAREATTAQRDLERQLDRIERKLDDLLSRQQKGPA